MHQIVLLNVGMYVLIKKFFNRLTTNSINSGRVGLFQSINCDIDESLPLRVTKQKKTTTTSRAAKKTTVTSTKVVVAKPKKTERVFSNETLDYITKKFKSSVSVSASNLVNICLSRK